MTWTFFALLAGCGEEEQQPPPPGASDETIAALEARIAALEAALADQDPPEVPEHEEYTDEMAVAAVQNGDPWSDPDRANLENLWHSTSYGYHWLDLARWTMDNRSDPPGATPRHELTQMFHETPECAADSTFAGCNSTAALKMYVNGPRITDNDWSEAGFAAAAERRYHTHASGIYLVSFGQYATVSDYAYGLIPPSGVHLEPHGAHQGLRIDGTGNSGENVRIDTTLGSTGVAIYESPAAGLYCDQLGLSCEDSYPLYLRGGTVHLEDLRFERTAYDARNAGAAPLHAASLGVEHFYTWHSDAQTGLPVHCAWNTEVRGGDLVRVQPYSTSPDLTQAHTYVLVDVWGPGGAPPGCAGTQLLKTDAAGVYGYAFDAGLLSEGGFSVAILGADGSPLDPGEWGEVDRPAFLFEVITPL